MLAWPLQRLGINAVAIWCRLPRRVRKSDIKVGVFVLFGLVLAALVIFLIGDTRRLFERAHTYHLAFEDIAGLKKGAPVQMGGLMIGHVETIDYSKDASDPHIYVTIEVVAGAASRLRVDGVASIVNKGFLGDKMLLISRGESSEAVPSGGTVKSDEPSDLMKKFSQIGGEAEATMGDVKRVAAALADEQLHADIRASAKKVDRILGEVTEGQGYPHRLLSDPEEAKRISRTIENLDKSAAELALTLRDVRQLAEQVKSGPGFAHDLIYGEGVSKPLAQVGSTAEELGLTLRELRTGHGFAHDVLFGGDGAPGTPLSNVSAMTADLRDIVHGVKEGKGTLGALLVDPSVYEDVKRLLGNVERNAVLRSLVRYSIQANEGQPASAPTAPPAR